MTKVSREKLLKYLWYGQMVFAALYLTSCLVGGIFEYPFLSKLVGSEQAFKTLYLNPIPWDLLFIVVIYGSYHQWKPAILANFIGAHSVLGNAGIILQNYQRNHTVYIGNQTATVAFNWLDIATIIVAFTGIMMLLFGIMLAITYFYIYCRNARKQAGN